MNWEFIKGKTLEFTSNEIKTCVFKATNQMPQIGLVELTHNPSTYQSMIDHLTKRLRSNSAIVVLKAMIVLIRLVRQGREYFGDSLKHHRSPLKEFTQGSRIEIFAEYGDFVRNFASYVDQNTFADNSLIRNEISSFRDRSVDMGYQYIKFAEIQNVLNRYVELLKLLLQCSKTYPPNNGVSKAVLDVLLKDAGGFYRLLSEGIIKIVDEAFNMELKDAEVFLELYRTYIDISHGLKAFTDYVKDEWKSTIELVVNTEVPEKFLATLEAHVTKLKTGGVTVQEGVRDLTDLINVEELPVEEELSPQHIDSSKKKVEAGEFDDFDDFFASRQSERKDEGQAYMNSNDLGDFDFFASSTMPESGPVHVQETIPVYEKPVTKSAQNVDPVFDTLDTGGNASILQQGYVSEQKDDFASLFNDMRQKDWGEDLL